MWRKLLEHIRAVEQRRNSLRIRVLALGAPPGVEVLESRLLPSPVAGVESILRNSPAGQETAATSVAYAVTFNQNVSGVDAADFQLLVAGSVQASSSLVVSGSGSTYGVTVDGIHGNGSLTLNLIDNDSIMSTPGNPIPLGGIGAGNGSFQGETYVINQEFPQVTSIQRVGSQNTQASSAAFTVNFSTAVTGVASNDFELVTTGTITATPTVSVSGG